MTRKAREPVNLFEFKREYVLKLGELIRTCREKSLRSNYPGLKQKRRNWINAEDHLTLEDVAFMTDINYSTLQTLELPPPQYRPQWHLLNRLLSRTDFMVHEDGTPYIAEELLQYACGVELENPALSSAVSMLYQIHLTDQSSAKTKVPKRILPDDPTRPPQQWYAWVSLSKKVQYCRFTVDGGSMLVEPADESDIQEQIAALEEQIDSSSKRQQLRMSLPQF